MSRSFSECVSANSLWCTESYYFFYLENLSVMFLSSLIFYLYARSMQAHGSWLQPSWNWMFLLELIEFGPIHSLALLPAWLMTEDPGFGVGRRARRCFLGILCGVREKQVNQAIDVSWLVSGREFNDSNPQPPQGIPPEMKASYLPSWATRKNGQNLRSCI